MICTARSLLGQAGLTLEETEYARCGDAYLSYPMSMGTFFECMPGTEGWYLRYRHHLRMDILSQAHHLFPALKKADLNWLADRPIFTERLSELNGLERTELAVEGGPCLFGADEVYDFVRLYDGTRLCFDDSSGNCCMPGMPKLADFLRERGDEVAQIEFLNQKNGFSSQEMELLTALFTVASALECPLVLSLPDMSYQKYFDQLARWLGPGVREQAREDYRSTLYRITDLYLRLTELLRVCYPVPRLEILHERNREVYETFLRERERYCAIGDVTTNRPDRRESILDYICFPAAPHYLLGVGHVLEINSTDEADPVRKCAKFHRGHLHLHQLMLPEPLSQDKSTSVFNARQKNKGYVLMSKLERRSVAGLC